MRHVSPPYRYPLDDEWTQPLEGLARAIVGVRRFRYFDLGDFMIMGKEVRRPRPDVYLYKHVHTRRYVNLDQAGHAYRYIGPKTVDSTYSGRYVAHRNLRTALDHLELWLLPWMKPGLEAERFGLSWRQKYVFRPQYVGDANDKELASIALREIVESERWEAENGAWRDELLAAGVVEQDPSWECW